MSRAAATLVLVLGILLTPAPADAWGAAGHRLIMRQAIALLPPELRSFFERYADEVVMRSNDPDLWRNIPWDDDSNHFVDFGVREYGADPFAALPREYDRAVQKFGVATVRRNGTLPWRLAELHGSLQRAFEELKRSAPYTASNIVLFSAVASHYMQDATQPFHATDNYDGRATGNDGIHSRFERDLIERFESRLHLSPAGPVPIVDARTAAFDTLIAGHRLVDQILADDREAARGKQVYDDDYYEKFFVKVQPILERQLSEAISKTAGLIIGAWQQAGRPAMRLRDVRPLQRVRQAP
jgi:hypothetical protein